VTSLSRGARACRWDDRIQRGPDLDRLFLTAIALDLGAGGPPTPQAGWSMHSTISAARADPSTDFGCNSSARAGRG